MTQHRFRQSEREVAKAYAEKYAKEVKGGFIVACMEHTIKAKTMEDLQVGLMLAIRSGAGVMD